jgi:hypothetical protein
VYAITDRGPNQDCNDLSKISRGTVANGKGFPLEKFSPTVTELELVEGDDYVNDNAGGLIITKMMPLHYIKAREGPDAWNLDKYGEYATGRGNKGGYMQYRSDYLNYGKMPSAGGSSYSPNFKLFAV